jgi:hypothetical protein
MKCFDQLMDERETSGIIKKANLCEKNSQNVTVVFEKTKEKTAFESKPLEGRHLITCNAGYSGSCLPQF